ncbi:MAG TPA: molybdopterin cofactor-binding domain-containing protein, partial [Limnochordales bacterium]
THTVPAGAFRGFGVPQVAFAHECQMDRIARELGMDPVELRLRNLVRRGEPLWEGDLPMDAEPSQGLRAVVEGLRRAVASTPARRPWAPGAPWAADVRVLAGEGFSVAFKAPMSPSDSEAEVRLGADGQAELRVGTTELGQGARTVLVQIAAQELGLPVSRWRVAVPDTDRVPFDQSTNGSRSTTLTGLAVQRAARDLREQLAEAARQVAGQRPQRFEDGCAWVGEQAWPLEELVRRVAGEQGALVGRGRYQGDRTPTPQGARVPFWELGMGSARVEVDPETGWWRVSHCVTAADVGKAIHPELCHGQDQGGAMMGMGAALFEELRYQEGQLLNGSLTDYRAPTFDVLPDHLESILVENGDGPGPWGAKGAGESGVYVTVAAVANAVYAATGRMPRRLPLTPERMWRLLRGGNEGEQRQQA